MHLSGQGAVGVVCCVLEGKGGRVQSGGGCQVGGVWRGSLGGRVSCRSVRSRQLLPPQDERIRTRTSERAPNGSVKPQPAPHGPATTNTAGPPTPHPPRRARTLAERRRRLPQLCQLALVGLHVRRQAGALLRQLGGLHARILLEARILLWVGGWVGWGVKRGVGKRQVERF